ncbi:MAG: hypothetical protein K0U47_02975 [Epsilonproteobacteria bacterium]|nr:hypothetical protein [Campylobacterota bacterium]
MYTVQMEHECGCFKKSEYKSEKSFDNQKDAYQYSNILVELMSEEFCNKHLFFVQKANDNEFLIRVVDNPNAGSACSSGGCGTGSSGSCGC